MNNVLTIPNDIEAEQALLGAIIEDNNVLNDIQTILKPNDFFNENHQDIYFSCKELFGKKSPIDEVTLSDNLKSHGKLENVGGIGYIVELIDCCPVSGNFKYYAKIIKDHSVMRQMLDYVKNLSERARNPEQNVSELLATAENELVKLTINNQNNTVIRDIKSITSDIAASLEQGEIVGIKTGFLPVDKMIIALEPGDLIILGGRPGSGKTSFATNIISNVAKSEFKKHVLKFSLEMTDVQIGTKIYSQETKIHLSKFRNKKFEVEDWERLHSSAGRLTGLNNIHIADKITANIETIRSLAVAHNRNFPLSLIVIDHLGLTSENERSREREISRFTSGCKQLAKYLNVPVLLLSQLNRGVENRNPPIPKMSDLKDSGSIEADADLIFFLYREEYYEPDTDKKGLADLIIAKQRNGPTGAVGLGYHKETTNFYNLSNEEFQRWINLRGRT